MKNSLLLPSILLLSICTSCGVPEKRILDSEKIVYFVSADYSLRDKGYDWSVVSIRKIAEDSAFVNVRSRADRKKPSKTFSGTGITNSMNKIILFISQK